MKLMVLNLPRTLSKEELTKLFKTYGAVKECTIVMDAQTRTSKGFGFVEMAVEAEGKIAVEKLNGSMVGQKKIRVKAA